jgi:hypothetical protein
MSLAKLVVRSGLCALLAACGPKIVDTGEEPAPAPDGDAPGDVFSEGYTGDVGVADFAPPVRPPVDNGFDGHVWGSWGESYAPLAGARVTVLGPNGSAMSAVTDAEGAFRIETWPDAYVVVVEGKRYWGTASAIDIPEGGLHGFTAILSAFDTDVQRIATMSGHPFPESDGIVMAYFTAFGGGETVKLSAQSLLPVTMNAQDQLVESTTMMPGGAPWMMYTGVEPGMTEVAAYGASGQEQCRAASSPLGEWPSLPHVITYVSVVCVGAVP